MSIEKNSRGDVSVVPFEAGHRAAALDVAMRSSQPVFPRMRDSVLHFVYDDFYPDGWRARQAADLVQVLDEEPGGVDVAMLDGAVVGWVCTRIHTADSMGKST